MKILWSWLNDHLSVTESIDHIADALTHSGTEAEKTEAYSWTNGFQVAQVLVAAKHPNAENLKVCDVRLGDGQIVSIVCGATNVRPGLKTIVALPGCLLPGSISALAACILRGVPSNGMLCSARELSMEDLWGDVDGLVELPENTVIGTPLRHFLPSDDALLHLNVTPNRGDLLSHRGVARELMALGLGVQKTTPIWEEMPFPNEQLGEVLAPSKILNLENQDCLFFQLCRIENIHQRRTPAWIKRRLMEISTKWHGPCVDITNYAAEDNGQPLHAFDADALQGDLHIRASKAGESFQALDGETYTLPAGAPVISDDAGILSLAGIMGGMRGRCQSDTRTVLLEAACFEPTAIARAGRMTRLNSASRSRFERGVDPDFCATALLQSARWISEQTGGSIAGLSQVGSVPKRTAISFDPTTVATRCGVHLPLKTIAERLEKWGAIVVVSQAQENGPDNGAKTACEDGSDLSVGPGAGFIIGSGPSLPSPTTSGPDVPVCHPGHASNAVSDRLSITPPSWRWDWQDSWDCVTETLRGQGYAEIPVTPLPSNPLRASMQKYTGGALAPLDYSLLWDLRDFWIAQGFYEVVTWSFVSSAMAQPFFQGTDALWQDLQLSNALSKEFGVLRPSIIPSLASIQTYHQKYGLSFQPIFEIGPRFFGLLPTDQQESLTALWPIKKSDAWRPHDPDAPKEWSFYDVKGMVDRCVGALDICNTIWLRSSSAWYHPGQSARLMQNTPDGQIELAVIGRLHPRLNIPAFTAELHLNAWKKLGKKAFYKIPSLQPVGKDLSFYVPQDALVGPVLQKMSDLPLAELDRVMVIDIFEGPNSIQESMDPKSMASLDNVSMNERLDSFSDTDLKSNPNDQSHCSNVAQFQRSITIRCIFQPNMAPFSSSALQSLMHTVVQCALENHWVLRGTLDEPIPKL
jgi:phenylalanyl-tRNA synthetase beta chain